MSGLRLLLLLALLAQPWVLQAGTFQVERKASGATLIWQDSTGRRALGDLLVLPAGTRFYHWGSDLEAGQIRQTGGVSQAGLDARMAKGGGNQGGGFYASMDPWDSHGYGRNLSVVELEHESLFALTKFTHAIRAAEFSSYSDYQQALRIAGVQGTYYLPSVSTDFSSYRSDRWLNLVDAAATSSVRAGNFHDLVDPEGFTGREFRTSSESLLKIALSINARCPLEKTAWLSKNIPVLDKLLDGLPLSDLEHRDVAQALSYRQAEDSSNLATRLKREFHDEYVNLVKGDLATFFNISSLQEPGRNSGLDQRLERAGPLGVRLDEIFSPTDAEKVARYYAETAAERAASKCDRALRR